MIGQKLVKILQTLDPAAFRRLGDAIASPLRLNRVFHYWSALRERRVKTPRRGVGLGMEEEAGQDRARRKSCKSCLNPFLSAARRA